MSHPESASSKGFLLSPQQRAGQRSSLLPAIISFMASFSCTVSLPWVYTLARAAYIWWLNKKDKWRRVHFIQCGILMGQHLLQCSPPGCLRLCRALDGSMPSLSKQSSFVPLPFMVLLPKKRIHSSGIALVSATEESKIFLVIAKLFNYAVIHLPRSSEISYVH